MDRNQIWLKATELGALVAECDEVAQFRAAEQALFANAEAAAIVRSLHDAQEELIRAQDAGDAAAGEKPGREIERLLDWAETHAEVIRFQEAQQAMQALMGTVSQIIAESVTRHADLRRR